MPRLTIDKELYKNIKEQYEKIGKTLEDHNEGARRIKIEEQFKALGDDIPTEKAAEAIALYILAKENEPLVESEFTQTVTQIRDDVLENFGGLTEYKLNGLTTALYNEVPVNEFLGVKTNGELITPKDLEEKEEKEKAFQEKQEKEQKEIEEDKKKEKAKQKAKEAEEKKKGEEFWAGMEKNVPNLGEEQVKEEPKNEFGANYIDATDINAVLDVAIKMYSGNDNRSFDINDKREFVHTFTDTEIGNKIASDKHPEPSVTNVIDRFAMYKVQQQKMNSLPFYKRWFPGLFSDSKQIRDNMKNIEKSFEPKISSKAFKDMANPGKDFTTGHFIKDAISFNFVSWNNTQSARLFGPEKENKREVYFAFHPELMEKDPTVKKGMLEAEIAHQKEIKNEVNKLGKQIIITDKEVQENYKQNQKDGKELYDLQKEIDKQNGIEVTVENSLD